jgi:hypothetical protein
MGRGAGIVCATVAAGGEDDNVRTKPVQCAVFEVPRDNAAATSLLIHDQIEGEIFDKELRVMA